VRIRGKEGRARVGNGTECRVGKERKRRGKRKERGKEGTPLILA